MPMKTSWANVIQPLVNSLKVMLKKVKGCIVTLKDA
jgi:hypothetical protein